MSRSDFLLVLFAIFFLFASCAKKEPEVDFKPIQIRWNLAQGEDESKMPRKDNCVILLTARLMAEPPVQASSAGELSYEVTYSRSAENPEILKFDGICRDLSIMDKPECRWEATCDADCKIVVNFHNGD
ncbi:hypothetical protein SAMN05720487_10896 [Fibrobacter sp. UWT2]|uniref:hypothetical protein n=1 Tax=Fibrobacter sp. UWT2 TaxID=1896224 RepID=UPI0009207AA6|nr:hypothetical protein [Fibrobacter sp. UWT2]SHL13838.1 hypothetical protein SAMN05720487_10896 [Fibrobacter sp. UWT2]